MPSFLHGAELSWKMAGTRSPMALKLSASTFTSSRGADGVGPEIPGCEPADNLGKVA